MSNQQIRFVGTQSHLNDGHSFLDAKSKLVNNVDNLSTSLFPIDLLTVIYNPSTGPISLLAFKIFVTSIVSKFLETV